MQPARKEKGLGMKEEGGAEGTKGGKEGRKRTGHRQQTTRPPPHQVKKKQLNPPLSFPLLFHPFPCQFPPLKWSGEDTPVEKQKTKMSPSRTCFPCGVAAACLSVPTPCRLLFKTKKKQHGEEAARRLSPARRKGRRGGEGGKEGGKEGRKE